VAAHLTDDVDSEVWQAALAQMADLKSALSNNELTAALADSIARRWGTSVRTVWRRAKAFREDSGLRSMLHRRRGPLAGVCKLDSTVESIISDTARAWWKATENATSAEIYPAIVRECAGRGVPRPSRATVVRRLTADLRGYRSAEPGWIAERICCLSVAVEIRRMIMGSEPAFERVRTVLESDPSAKQLLLECWGSYAPKSQFASFSR
jgi:hypothetical protein